MRLGAFECELAPKSLAHRLYGKKLISERHRHRYEFNNAYKKRLEAVGMKMSGINPELDLAEIGELESHPYFIGSQFHPEFQSRPLEPHPLFLGLIEAGIKKEN